MFLCQDRYAILSGNRRMMHLICLSDSTGDLSIRCVFANYNGLTRILVLLVACLAGINQPKFRLACIASGTERSDRSRTIDG